MMFCGYVTHFVNCIENPSVCAISFYDMLCYPLCKYHNTKYIIAYTIMLLEKPTSRQLREQFLKSRGFQG
jgi:hypothetical protein